MEIKAYFDDTFGDAIKNEKEGSVISLNDSSPLGGDIGCKVESENLIPYPYADTTKTKNGITFTDNGDGTITVNGTATDWAEFYCRKFDEGIEDLQSRIFFASGCPSGGSFSTYRLEFAGGGTDSWDIGEGLSMNVSKPLKLLYIKITIEKGYTANNLVFKPKLQKGTVATPYTPYIPDLSQTKIGVYGKNLFDKNTYPLIKDCWINYLTGGLVIDPGSLMATKDYIPIKSNAIINLNHIPSFGNPGMAFYSAKTESSYISGGKGNAMQVPANAKYMRFTIDAIYEDDIQIELGTIATDYEPYIPVKTYTPLSDGTVPDIQLNPYNNTILSDTEGVNINLSYNADYKTYLDNGFNEAKAIILGGTKTQEVNTNG